MGVGGWVKAEVTEEGRRSEGGGLFRLEWWVGGGISWDSVSGGFGALCATQMCRAPQHSSSTPLPSLPPIVPHCGACVGVILHGCVAEEPKPRCHVTTTSACFFFFWS